MADDPDPQKPEGGDPDGGKTPPTGDSWTAPASQEELNRIIADRVARERDKYKDVAALRQKATEYDKLIAEKQTAEEKALARAEAAERKAQELEAAQQAREEKEALAKQIEDWKSKISAEEKFAGVPAAALRGNTEEELREHAAQLKALIPDPDPRRGAYVPSEGQHTGSGSADPRTQFAELIKGL